MIDTPSDWHVRADTRITDTFVDGLCEQFELGVVSLDIRTELKQAAARYFRDLEAFGSETLRTQKAITTNA